MVPQVKYSVHDSTNGWSAYGENGIELGSTKSGLKLDAIKIALENSKNANVKYRVHAENVGWLEEVQNNQQTGMETQKWYRSYRNRTRRVR